MAGPTPAVSALIHAATMVTAGVYMIARSSQIFLHAAGALDIVAMIGDCNRVLRRDHRSDAERHQESLRLFDGFAAGIHVRLALGAGAFSAGIYHVMTHAFFKALLFLGAGSVIHALSGEQDLRKMGGLRKYTPITFVTLLCCRGPCHRRLPIFIRLLQ